MTCREKLKIEHPEDVSGDYEGGCFGCPHDYGYLDRPWSCDSNDPGDCWACWDREIPRTVQPTAMFTPDEFENAMLEIKMKYKDESGFEEDAHRDMDKLMCDLLRSLGYADGVRVYLGTKRWYA